MRLYRFFTVVLGVSLLGLMLGCSSGKKKEITVLIKMMSGQERFFREQVIPEFESRNNCKVSIATFNNDWDIERLLKLEAGKKEPTIALVKTPFELTREMVTKGYMSNLYSVLDSEQVIFDMAEYHQLASGLGYFEGLPYYIPRKLETRILFYRKSKVADAINKLEKHRARINAELKAQNGYGLPSGYVLESNPSEWDFYDLYVVGSIWANEEYNGVKMGRMAHRGARYSGTALDLVDRSLQLGASREDVIRLTSDKTVSTYVWERAFIKNGIYNQGMWQDPWKGANLYTAIKDGKVFLTYVQQIDAFLIHGWKDDPSMPTNLPDEDDMGLAVVPQAVSFELDDTGKPVFEGTREISTGGWWWGIPKTAPKYETDICTGSLYNKSGDPG